jgi:hypothetical protein
MLLTYIFFSITTRKVWVSDIALITWYIIRYAFSALIIFLRMVPAGTLFMNRKTLTILIGAKTFRASFVVWSAFWQIRVKEAIVARRFFFLFSFLFF